MKHKSHNYINLYNLIDFRLNYPDDALDIEL